MSALPSLRSPIVYGPVLGLTALTAGVALWPGVSLGAWALPALAVAVTVTGIPHGAIDHLVATELYGLDFTWQDQAKFYGAYLALMALYGAFWVVLPELSLWAFLLMTMYHFGQADLSYWNLPAGQARLAYLSRGLFLIGLPVVAFPEVVAPIFGAIARGTVLPWTEIAAHQSALLAGLVGQHVLVLGGLALAARPPARAWREAVNVAVLAALFIGAHPLVAFAVYFGGWHALGHILEMIRFFNRRGIPMTIGTFYRKALPLTVLSFVMLGALYAALEAFGNREQMIALLFILIAVMTLPHMVIVERMFHRHEAVTSAAEPAA